MNRLYLFSLVLWFSLALSHGAAIAHQQDSLAGVPAPTDIPSPADAVSTAAQTSPPSPHPSESPAHYPSDLEEANPQGRYGIAVEELTRLFQDRGISRTTAHQPAYKVSLPDLQTLPPSELRLVYDPSTGRKILRFTNSIWNSGLGQLELIGRQDRTAEHIRVYQKLFAGGEKGVVGVWEVGEFVFHDQHRHWHLDDFAQYEVRALRIEGGLGRAVAAGSKLSYCILDITRGEVDPGKEEYPLSARYLTCNAETQGLSPGWVDVYGQHLPRQWVDVTNLPDGVYALVSTVNPDQIVLELDVDNNSDVTYFELKDMRARVVEEPDRTHIPALLSRLNRLER